MELLSESTVGLLSDYCRTTVGLSDYCRTVGILSDTVGQTCRTVGPGLCHGDVERLSLARRILIRQGGFGKVEDVSRVGQLPRDVRAHRDYESGVLVTLTGEGRPRALFLGIAGARAELRRPKARNANEERGE